MRFGLDVAQQRMSWDELVSRIRFGTTTPFTSEQLAALYTNHDGFVSAWNQATKDALSAGFLVREDAQHLRVVGAQSDILK
jgi:hypothetical protein